MVLQLGSLQVTSSALWDSPRCLQLEVQVRFPFTKIPSSLSKVALYTLVLIGACLAGAKCGVDEVKMSRALATCSEEGAIAALSEGGLCGPGLWRLDGVPDSCAISCKPPSSAGRFRFGSRCFRCFCGMATTEQADTFKKMGCAEKVKVA